MADLGAFKQANRQRRQNSLVTDFSSGMMFTSGAVEPPYVKTLVNFDIDRNSTALAPRSGLQTSELILPEFDNNTELPTYHTSDSMRIMAAKECTENNNVYQQFILGAPDTNKLWVTTATASPEIIDSETVINLADGKTDLAGTQCTYFNAPLSSAHGMSVSLGYSAYTLIGTFAFGNNFYFSNGKGLNRTVFDKEAAQYRVESVEPKQIDASSAVTYGYNMLLDDPYNFVSVSGAGTIKLQGILPYSDEAEPKLQMTPKKNESIQFRCFFKANPGERYKFIWEWRNVSSDEYTVLQTLEQSKVYTVSDVRPDGSVLLIPDGADTGETYISQIFKAPTEEIMVRIQAYNMRELEGLEEGFDPTTEQAMTVGFDFTQDNVTSNLKVEYYNLASCVGMAFWKNRLVLYGVEEDPTILFISDLNEPTYFPYPNNVTVFDEAIVSVKEYMDSLLVFTTSKIYQVTTEDGVSFKSTVIQSHLNISPFDRKLIQVVRNMVFFKSGNYYFMIVPKSQSTTGELTLAPVSNSIVEFFNNFESNVHDILSDTFDYQGSLTLLDYYNFLDYEDVNNMYVLQYNKTGKVGLIYLDVLYNVVARTWRLHVFETPGFLYPYKQDATQRGVLSSTSVVDIDFGQDYVWSSEEFTAKEAISSGAFAMLNIPFDLDTKSVRLQLEHNGEIYFDHWFADIRLISDDPTFGKFHYELRDNTSCYAVLNLCDDQLEGFRLYNQDIIYGSKYTFIDIDTGNVILEGYNRENDKYINYDLPYSSLTSDLVFEVNGVQATVDDMFYNTAFPIREFLNYGGKLHASYRTSQVKPYPKLKVLSKVQISDQTEVLPSTRIIQLHSFNEHSVKDVFIPDDTSISYDNHPEDASFTPDLTEIKNSVADLLQSPENYSRFMNWQFLDTGYVKDNIHANKRYRELQFHINNIDAANLDFGMEFRLDGQSRKSLYAYEVQEIADEFEGDTGVIFLQTSMNLSDVPLEYIPSREDVNYGPHNSRWVLNQTEHPERSIWKVRAPISGKGIAPRLRLASRNTTKYTIMGIYWVYRVMHMR